MKTDPAQSPRHFRPAVFTIPLTVSIRQLGTRCLVARVPADGRRSRRQVHGWPARPDFPAHKFPGKLWRRPLISYSTPIDDDAKYRGTFQSVAPPVYVQTATERPHPK